MKKLFFFLAFLCCAVTQLKADVIQPSTTPYYPEHVYTMKNANGWYADASTHGTQNAASYGHFAFYPVSGVDNAYYIYSVDNNQWLTYTKAASYSNQRDFISMSDTFGIDDYFYLNQRATGFYDIAPYNNSGVASKYLNWYEGANESHETIGLWQQNLNDDPGSKFTFTEVTTDSNEIPYFTVTSKGRGTWVVSNSMTTWEGQISATLDASNELQHFAFIKKNGIVYLYNKGISKYINKDYTFTDDPKDGITFLYGNSIDGDKESGINTDNSFVICFDNSKFINLGGSNQIVIDNWGPNSSSNSNGKTDGGNCVTITKQGTFTIAQPEPEPNPEVETDRSEELAPEYGKVDCQGIKVNAVFGTYNNEEYSWYHNWSSNKVASVWVSSQDGVHTYQDTPLVSINAFRYDNKEASPRFNHDGEGSHTLRFSLSSYLTGMTIQAAPGYAIVGYCFDYTSPADITDVSSFEGEITCTAGTHHVELKGIETQSTDIYFGKISGYAEATISNFYVFIRKGTLLTQEKIDTFKDYYYLSEVFTLSAKDYPNSNLYAPQDKNMLDICGEDCNKYNNVTATAEDVNQQFMLIPFDTYYSKYTQYNGCYFLYNLGAGKFVSKEGTYTTLTEHPRQPISIEEGTGDKSGYFKISFKKENLLNVSPGHCKADEEETSCVVTNWNTLDNGNHFQIRIVRDLNKEAGNLMDNVRFDMTMISDASIIDSKAEELQALLDKNGVGYPTSDLRDILADYKENIVKYKEQSALFDLELFLPEYKASTSVQMPENGKAYRIKTHYMGSLERYLQAGEGGVLKIVNGGAGLPKDNSTVFVARSIGEAANGQGTYALVGENAQFLVGARTGTQGFVASYDEGSNTGDLRLVTAANKGDYFGGFLLQTTEGTNTYNLQLGSTTASTDLVITYDAENPNSIINDPYGGSSIFFLEEVSYPNEVELRSPTVDDGKTYSSIWLPFSTEIPEGVSAYKAYVDPTTNQLVCGEVKNVLPAGEGAILIASEAKKVTLVPSIADVAPLENNSLKGTNITLARNNDVTTFVLNGGKGEIGFYPYTGTNIAKYKAYVEVNKELAAQGLRFSFGTATDIENTLTEGEDEAKEYYDLSGRRVAHPTKGLYIVNGKKMYIK